MKFLPFFLVLSTILLVACAQGTPQIHSSHIQRIQQQESDGLFYERLSLFLFFNDSDGTKDFSTITLEHPETGMLWTVSSDSVMKRMRGKDTWLGTNQISAPSGEQIPSGEYIITVSDLAGNEAVTPVSLIRPGFPETVPCTISITGETWLLERNTNAGQFTRIFFLFFDAEDRLVATWRVPDTSKSYHSGTLSSLRSLAPSGVRFRCFVENLSATAGVLLSPVNLR